MVTTLNWLILDLCWEEKKEKQRKTFLKKHTFESDPD